MILSEQLSVVQNFIIFENNKARLDLLCSDDGLKTTSTVLDGCSFYVNYKTTTSLFNNLEGDDFHWADITLQLIKESTTPYVMLLTEDRLFTNTTKEYFYSLMVDFVNKEVNYMAIGKLTL